MSAPAFNPFTPQFNVNPYAAFERLRATPVFSVPGCLGNDWIVTGFEAARQALTDHRLLADDLPARIRENAARAGNESSVHTLCSALQAWLFFLDAPAHTTVRRVLSDAFTKNAVSQLRVDIRACVRGLIEPCLRRGEFDAIEHIARPLPVHVALKVMGLREQATGALVHLSSELFGIFTQPLTLRRYQALDGVVSQMHEELTALLTETKITDPGLAGDLLRAHHHGSLSMQEVLACCAMILSVGQDTTQNLIGNSIHALLEHPDELRELLNAPESIPKAVRELARYNPPVQLVVRIAAEPLILGEVQIQPGERVHVFLGAALRDSSALPDSDRLDIRRAGNLVLPFGAGRHFCLGFHLALLQAEIVLEVLLPVFHRLQISVERLEWLRSVHMRGLKALPLQVTR